MGKISFTVRLIRINTPVPNNEKKKTHRALHAIAS